MKDKKFITKKKSAMTLAEILIVVAIIAVVSIIFVSIEGKSRDMQEKTKYYIAYTTLQKLLQEQVAETGTIAIQNSSTICSSKANEEEKNACYRYAASQKLDVDHTFAQMVNKWLNVAYSCTWSDDKCTKIAFNVYTSTNAVLTNGMYFDWSNMRDGSHPYSIRNENGVVTQRLVKVDIDGIENGRAINWQDIHYFILNTNGTGNDFVRVKPVRFSNFNNCGSECTDHISYTNNVIDPKDNFWLSFKVYRVNDEGNTKIVLYGSDYQTAYNCYNARSGVCDNACENNDCFIEPIPPLK